MASRGAYNNRVEAMDQIYQSFVFQQAEADTLGDQIAERNNKVPARDGDFSDWIAPDWP